MFGRKARKQAEQEALKKMMEEAEANRRAALAAEEQAKIYYDSEILFDDDELNQDPFIDTEEVQETTAQRSTGYVALPIHGEDTDEQSSESLAEQAFKQAEEDVLSEAAPENNKEEPVETIAPQAQTPVAEPVKQPVSEAVKEEATVEEDTEDSNAESEPEIRYVVDGPAEDDEIVKPAKLVKLPNLIDYMLSLNISKKMKINIATLLIGAYAKYKDIPAEREIIIGCMKKVMRVLI